MSKQIFEKLIELDSSFDKVLQKIYDAFMPSKTKTVPLLNENSRK